MKRAYISTARAPTSTSTSTSTMSGLELALLGLAGASYMDAKHQIVKDLGTIKGAVGSVFSVLLNIKRGHINAWTIFEGWVKAQPDKVFLVYPEPVAGAKARFVNGVLDNGDDLFKVRQATYKETHTKCLQWARLLHDEYGVRPGESVAMDFVNKDDFIYVWFGLWSLGAVPAFINYNLQTKSLTHCVRAAKAQVLLVDSEVAENGLEVAEELKAEGIATVIVDDAFKAKVAAQTPLDIGDKRGLPDMADAACYIYTSGTTGLPKAGIMSWRKIMSASVYASAVGYTQSERLYSAMPLYHSTASVLGVMPAVHVGASYAIGHKFSTTTFWTQVKLAEATAIQYVGETCRYLYNAPYNPDERRHKVHKAMGNGLRPDIWMKLKERFGIKTVCEFYGATELPTVLTNQQNGDFAVGACGSYGTLLGGIFKTAIFGIFRVDPDTQELWRDPNTGLCAKASVNEPGELMFKVNAADVHAQFQGYLGNEKATNEKIAFDVKSKGDAYIRSGDLLRIDADNSIYFVDRLGDTFRWKSENVSTNEVEEALTDVEGISQVVCVGVQVPKHEGRAGFAVVQLKDINKVPDLKHLGKHVLGRLPRYAAPVFIKFVEEIATTGNNKTQKKMFRAQKIPSTEEDIYWLKGDQYVKLTGDHWASVEDGSTKL